jgi:PAS domain S-box-containing protein
MDDHFIKVLLIEDNGCDARLVQELLKEVSSVQFELEHVERIRDGLQRLNETSFDVILLDLSLPDSQGFETFSNLHRQFYDIPIVVVTGLNDETLAIRAMQEGAQDYLVKGQVSGDLLVRSLRYAIERKRTEQKIREQAALLDVATDAIFVWDLASCILFWNKGAERLYGWQAEEVLGKTIKEIFGQQSLAQFQEVQDILTDRGEWYGELRQLTKTDRDVIVESRWTLVHDEKGKPKSILIVNTDVTEKKELAAQFLRAQRMESLGTLASGIAHDLNNILTPVLSTAQLLQMKFPSASERDRQLLKMLEVNAKRGAALVKQVLSFARGVEGEHTVLQIRHLIQEIQQIIQETFPKSMALPARVCLADSEMPTYQAS